MSDAAAIKPTRAPNSWLAIFLGFTTLIIASTLAVLMVRQYLESRPLDLTEHTRDLAMKTRLLLETNRVPSMNIDVVDSATRSSDTAVWWYYEMAVALPEELNARTVEQLIQDDLTARNVLVTKLESTDRLRSVSLSLAGLEFAKVILSGGSQSSAGASRDLTAATDRIAQETYQTLRRRLAPTTRFIQFPSEEQGDSTARWTHTRIEVALEDDTDGLTRIQDILAKAMANREVSVQSDGEIIRMRYLGHPCVELRLSTGELPEIQLPMVTRPVPIDDGMELPITEEIPTLDESPTLSPEPEPDVEPEEDAEPIAAAPTPIGTPVAKISRVEPAPAQQFPAPTADGLAERYDGPVRVAIIVDDGGNNQLVDEAFLEMDSRLTLAILPFTPFGRSTARLGNDRGFEIMLHMPMESDNERVTHPGMVLTSMEPEEIAQRFEAALDEVPYVQGVNNHTGSRFTSSAEDMSVVMEIARDRSLYFIDSVTSNHSAVRGVARDTGVPTARRDVFLDNEADPEYIIHQFEELLAKAKRRGWAIGICHFRPATAEVMPTLLARLEADGIELVHASDLVR